MTNGPPAHRALKLSRSHGTLQVLVPLFARELLVRLVVHLIGIMKFSGDPHPIPRARTGTKVFVD